MSLALWRTSRITYHYTCFKFVSDALGLNSAYILPKRLLIEDGY